VRTLPGHGPGVAGAPRGRPSEPGTNHHRDGSGRVPRDTRVRPAPGFHWSLEGAPKAVMAPRSWDSRPSSRNAAGGRGCKTRHVGRSRGGGGHRKPVTEVCRASVDRRSSAAHRVLNSSALTRQCWRVNPVVPWLPGAEGKDEPTTRYLPARGSNADKAAHHAQRAGGGRYSGG